MILNKKITTQVDKFESEIVYDLFQDCLWYPDDWESTKEEFINALYNTYDLTSEEEINIIMVEAKKQFDKKLKSSKVEAGQLQNRENIIDWIQRAIYYADSCLELDYGDVGYGLTPDQILDLIIQNGNKNLKV